MKKILYLSIFLTGALIFMSFISPTTKPKTYKVTCPEDGAVYYFQCDCELSAAQNIGNLICAMPTSEP